jgi:peroxiredoxin
MDGKERETMDRISLPRRARVLLIAGTATAVSLAGFSGLNAAPKAAKAEVGVGKKLEGFKLKDPTGKTHTLAEFKDRKTLVFVFLGTSCPISNSYAAPLSKLDERYRGQGVQILGVNANPDETLSDIAKHAQEYRLSFPVLKDAEQTLANRLAVKVTPEVFVLDRAHVLRYRGRLDDSYTSRTKQRRDPDCGDLQAAVEAILAGKPIAKPVTSAFGCALVRPDKTASSATAKVTYHRDVEPILQERCQSCHRPGQVAPFSLLSYADARSWATEIKEFATTRQMPPWKAEPGHGEFRDVRRMSDAEIATLAAWADGGAPEGDPKTAPVAKSWGDGWSLGKPDLVLTMPEDYHVTATGKDDFHCFVLPTGLTEDRDVVAVEVRPGNPRVVHHVLNFLDGNGRARMLDQKDPGPGYDSGPGGVGFLPTGAVGGWAPGNMPRFLPPDMGRALPKGSDVVIQVHYHKTGKPEVDRTSIGLYFSKEPVKKIVHTFPLTNLRIDIPAGEARHQVTQSATLPFAATAIAITPHMHLLGREMKVTATFPDGKVVPLVFIKDWDYRWQDTYVYKEPLLIPKGTKLDLVAYFDNSTANPLNPNNPPKRVTFGEQTTDEMCFAFIEYVTDGPRVRGGGLFGLLGAANPNSDSPRQAIQVVRTQRAEAKQ